MVALPGDMLTDCTDAEVTLSVVDPVREPKTALTVVIPLAWPVAVAPLMGATAVSDDAHFASDVMFSVLPSLKLPVAVNC